MKRIARKIKSLLSSAWKSVRRFFYIHVIGKYDRLDEIRLSKIVAERMNKAASDAFLGTFSTASDTPAESSIGLTFAAMREAIDKVGPLPKYSNLFCNELSSVNLKALAYSVRPYAPNEYDKDVRLDEDVYLAGMKIQTSPYVPLNRALAVGDTCFYCKRSVHSPVPCSDGRMMHQPEMAIIVLEDSNADQEKTNQTH